MLLNLCLLIYYCSTGYGVARPDGPARYAKRPTDPCLGRRSDPQAGKARPAGHDGPPRPVRQRAGPARCPGIAVPPPPYSTGKKMGRDGPYPAPYGWGTKLLPRVRFLNWLGLLQPYCVRANRSLGS